MDDVLKRCVEIKVNCVVAKLPKSRRIEKKISKNRNKDSFYFRIHFPTTCWLLAKDSFSSIFQRAGYWRKIHFHRFSNVLATGERFIFNYQRAGCNENKGKMQIIIKKREEGSRKIIHQSFLTSQFAEKMSSYIECIKIDPYKQTVEVTTVTSDVTVQPSAGDQMFARRFGVNEFHVTTLRPLVHENRQGVCTLPMAMIMFVVFKSDSQFTVLYVRDDLPDAGTDGRNSLPGYCSRITLLIMRF